jgi:hypothetical protein
MSLTDEQVKYLCHKMSIPLARICFKDELIEEPIEFNKAYVVNMQDSVDEQGRDNEGTHWVCFQVNDYQNGHKQAMYLDPYGVPPPVAVREYIKKYTGVSVPYSHKDIQSLMANCCGYFCLAFLHFINAHEHRSPDLYTNANTFLDMFEDLDKSCDYKKNEFILRHFFRPSDLEERKARGPIDLVRDFITKNDEEIKSTQHVKSL